MKRYSRFIWAFLMGNVLVLGLAGGPQLAVAEEPSPAAISQPDGSAHQIEHAEFWRARAGAAREQVAATQAELDVANAAVSRMRRRNHPRGEARRVIRDEQRRAQAAYDAARHHLDVELPADARAAGAEPIWLREPR